MKVKSSILILFLALAALALPVLGQDQARPQKKELVAELITVMNLEQEFPRIVDMMLQEMEKSYPLTISSVVDTDDSLTDEMKEELKASSGKRFTNFSQAFRKRLLEAVDYKKYINEAIVPIYDKYYTEAELKDLIAFYSTPTGKKLIETLPSILSASNEAARTHLLPKIVPIIEELVKKDLESLSGPRSDPPKKQN